MLEERQERKRLAKMKKLEELKEKLQQYLINQNSHAFLNKPSTQKAIHKGLKSVKKQLKNIF